MSTMKRVRRFAAALALGTAPACGVGAADVNTSASAPGGEAHQKLDNCCATATSCIPVVTEKCVTTQTCCPVDGPCGIVYGTPCEECEEKEECFNVTEEHCEEFCVESCVAYS